MRFDFATATRIIFGPGTMREAGSLAKELGRKALIITGRDQARAKNLATILNEQGIGTLTMSTSGEPDLETVQRGKLLAESENCDFVVAIGGGSALDAGKAIAAMLTNDGDLLDYLEVIGRGRRLGSPSAPFIAIPTTAGTGSEVTRNAVLASPEHRVKVSLRSPFMLPKVALVDPELTYDLPPSITASTGLDALTQLLEPFVSSRANPMTDAICVDGIRRVARSLRMAFEKGPNATTARTDMAAASLFGGMALSNAGLGAVHGFAGPIGGMFPAPHGAVCAALLPHVMETNLDALRHREPHNRALPRYYRIARMLTGQPKATPEAGVEWVRKLVTDFQIPSLRSYNITHEHTNDLVEKAAKASSMKSNPITLTPTELAGILERAL